MKKELSILIPTYNGDCRQQVEELSRQAEAVPQLTYEIVVADDGSTNPSAVALCRQVERWPHCRFIARKENTGRAAIRNFLAREARYEWLLFMDCDMTILHPDFLRHYLDSPTTDIAYGGYVVGQGERGSLRFIYEQQAAPMHRAEERRKRPYQHFHTCNFLVRRSLMTACPFDERFRHYGYEDVLLGKQLRQQGVKIDHLDNPAGFCQFEDNAHFVAKTEEGLRTLHAFSHELKGYSQLLTVVDGIHIAAVRWLIRLWHRLAGPLERRNLCGPHPSLRLFKLYKLGYYLTLNNKQ